MTELDKRYKKLLAVGLLVTSTLAVYLILFQPLIIQNIDLSKKIETLNDRRRNYIRLASMLPKYRHELDSFSVIMNKNPLIFETDNEVLGATTLQRRIGDVIRESEGKLLSIEILPSYKEKIFTRLSADIRFLASIKSFSRILYQIESSNPIIFITKMTIRPTSGWDSSGRGNDSLEIHLVAFTLMELKQSE